VSFAILVVRSVEDAEAGRLWLLLGYEDEV
jgi:hypothetical protein